MIYLKCICSNKPDLNLCVQESLGQHDMEMRACRVLNPSFPFHLHWHKSEMTQFQLLATLQLLSVLRKTNWHHSGIHSIITTNSRNHCLHGVQKRQEQLTMDCYGVFMNSGLGSKQIISFVALQQQFISMHSDTNLLSWRARDKQTESLLCKWSLSTS